MSKADGIAVWCKDCKWLDDFIGTCTNGDSYYRGDFVDEYGSCEHCERKRDK